MPRRGRAVRASIKVYTSSCRTSSPSAILDHHNSLVLLRVPPKRKRNPCLTASASTLERSLNESPYEKVEKYCFEGSHCCIRNASIKAPLKRKGNRNAAGGTPAVAAASMKALPKRKGNKGPIRGDEFREAASMKVYISSSRTSSRLVILSHHNSLVLIESPYKLYGNSQNFGFATPRRCCLNESPSEKEGKFGGVCANHARRYLASMKVPPKRKGNFLAWVPSRYLPGLNESPSEKEGKSLATITRQNASLASMKVPPKRKGNGEVADGAAAGQGLNESPSEKEGKFRVTRELGGLGGWASMKVPPKRKGNLTSRVITERQIISLNESPSEKEGKSFSLRSRQPRGWPQ